MTDQTPNDQQHKEEVQEDPVHTFSEEIEVAGNKVLETVRENDLRIVKQLSDKMNGRVDGRYADGTSFSIVS